MRLRELCWGSTLLAGVIGCGDASGVEGEGEGGTESETGAVADLALDQLDAVFTLSDGPIEIRSITGIDEHIGFPDIAQLDSGEILLVYREATKHAVDTAGRLVRQVGSSDALSWSAPELVHDVPDIDDRDPSITALSDGSIALAYFQYVFQATTDGPLTNYHVFYGESHDDGASFDDVAIVEGMMDYPGADVGPDGLWEDGDGQPISVYACTQPVFESGGQIHAPLYGGPPWVPTNPESPRSRVVLASSADHGGSWELRPLAPAQGEDLWLQEPSILAIDEQRWLMHVRAAEGDSPGNSGVMRQAISEDGGQTWSAYEDFDFIGQSPYLARLSSGVLLSAFRWYDDTLTTVSVNFMYSMDEGESWSEMIELFEPQLEETGHPTILELADGRVLFVYYVAGTLIEGLIYDVELVSI